ncbi:EcsC family protein [Aquiflexum sp. LQ15W]|uniref:EcsC family protein n=1 Tax=Cognataquiflexum nitidum TaxID=2922272 RepID=UPI001F1292B2|nr:EcsC family protein [Cognataquiflexum nitidum]MCH6199539.1 EcsC family protein [Cognataquiflexum nitidum]
MPQFLSIALYDDIASAELNAWLTKTRKRPGFVDRLTKSTQEGINSLIPEKVHQVITYAIEKMVKGVLFGTKYITPSPFLASTLEEKENKVKKIIKLYQNTASAEGAITGAGGILLGLADFPAFLTIKMKMLFEIAAAYGYDVKKFEERLYLLYIFKLTFSSQGKRNQTLALLENWDEYITKLPADVSDFDWRDFQLEYRDYLDLVKLAQLIPIIGAGVGAIANYKLANKLGQNAIQCYRLRHFDWQI